MLTRPLVNNYRLQLTNILLKAGQSVVFDGSGFDKTLRKKYFDLVKVNFPEVKTIIVWTDLPEDELLKRLQHSLDEYPHAIYFEGKAEMIEDAKQRENTYPLFKNRLKASEEILADAAKDGGHKFYKITVESWYAFGKFGQPSGNKYKLEWNKN